MEDVAMSRIDIEATFLKDHLAIWVPMFADRATDARPDAFYGSLVDLANSFVVHETDYASLIVDRRTVV
jgi:TorA maturation chaperone TorD